MKKSQIRKGLTLLELIVVLVVLVALGGLLVPLLPGMIGRAHTAEHATNVAEIAKAIQSYQVIHRGYPDNLDSLAGGIALLPGYTASSGSGSSATAASACSGQLTVGTVASVAGLADAGITTVWTPAGTNLVTAPYGSVTTGTALADGASVAMLSSAAMQRLYNETSTSSAQYVVFGLGSKCDIIGKSEGIAEAPIHFSDDPGDAGNPNLTYARFGLVFRVSNSSGTALERAQFAGVVALHEAGVTNASDAAAEFHAQSGQ